MILAFFILLTLAVFMWAVWEEFTGLIEEQQAELEAEQQWRVYDQDAA